MSIFNLVAADFKRILKDKPIRVVLIINIAFALLMFAIMKFSLSLLLEGLENVPLFDADIGSAIAATTLVSLFDAGNLAFYVSIAVAIFIGKDFNYNTIRNKIISGNPRYKIYISSYVTSLIIGLIFYIANLLIGLLFSVMFFGGVSVGIDLLYILLLIIPVYMAIIAIMTFVSMSIKSQALGIVINILIITVLPTLIALFFMFGDQNNAFVDFIYKFLPYTMTSEIIGLTTYLSPEMLELMGTPKTDGITSELIIRTIFTSIGYVAAFTGLGTFIFNNSDIK